MPFALDGRVISIVGAGGKTSAMLHLAAQAAGRVLVTTSTHIRRPADGFVRTADEVRALWDRGRYAVIGTPASDGKLSAPDERLLETLLREAALTLIEADGAKGLPAKAPAAHEPVILPQSDAVVAVLGLSALDRPLREVCFRLPEVCALLGAAPTDLLTVERAAVLLSSTQGARKDVGARAFRVLLNQCDDSTRERSGRALLDLLGDRWGIPGALSCFADGRGIF